MSLHVGSIDGSLPLLSNHPSMSAVHPPSASRNRSNVGFSQAPGFATKSPRSSPMNRAKSERVLTFAGSTVIALSLSAAPSAMLTTHPGVRQCLQRGLLQAEEQQSEQAVRRRDDSDDERHDADAPRHSATWRCAVDRRCCRPDSKHAEGEQRHSHDKDQRAEDRAHTPTIDLVGTWPEHRTPGTHACGNVTRARGTPLDPRPHAR